ncbi:hypothetical protein EPN27_04225 [Patescibacteria group bacterium]|nr:MAG: hypothetical protein EPN27_04225 [Patescibacteria group bacterium]
MHQKRGNINNKIGFDRETDRVYPCAPDTVVLEDESSGRKITIIKKRMNDVVVWNPWVEKSSRLDDFGDDEYKRMVCVETGNLHAPVKLVSGGTYTGSTEFVPQSSRQ